MANIEVQFTSDSIVLYTGISNLRWLNFMQGPNMPSLLHAIGRYYWCVRTERIDNGFAVVYEAGVISLDAVRDRVFKIVEARVDNAA